MKTPDRDSWCTPRWVWEAPLRAFRQPRYHIDPATNAHATVPAEVRYTIEDDALSLDWPEQPIGRLSWINPPYSTALHDAFTERVWTRMHRHDETWVGVIPMVVETLRWRLHGPDACIVLGRVAFDPPPGVAASHPGPMPLALCVWQREGALAVAHEIAAQLEGARYVCERTPRR